MKEFIQSFWDKGQAETENFNYLNEQLTRGTIPNFQSLPNPIIQGEESLFLFESFSQIVENLNSPEFLFYSLKEHILKQGSGYKKKGSAYEVSLPQNSTLPENAKKIISFVDENRCNILHYASSGLMARILIEKVYKSAGIDTAPALIQKDNMGNTPLKNILLKGDFAVVAAFQQIQQIDFEMALGYLAKEKFPCISKNENVYDGSFIDFVFNSYEFKKNLGKKFGYDKEGRDAKAFVSQTLVKCFELYTDRNDRNEEGRTPLFNLISLLIQNNVDKDWENNLVKIALNFKRNKISSEDILSFFTDAAGETPLSAFCLKGDGQKEDHPIAHFLFNLFPELFNKEALINLMKKRPQLVMAIWPKISERHPELTLENLIIYEKENHLHSIFAESYNISKVRFIDVCEVFSPYINVCSEPNLAPILFQLIEKQDFRMLRKLTQHPDLNWHIEFLGERSFIKVLQKGSSNLVNSFCQILKDRNDDVEITSQWCSKTNEIKIGLMVTPKEGDPYHVFEKSFPTSSLNESSLNVWKSENNFKPDANQLLSLFNAETMNQINDIFYPIIKEEPTNIIIENNNVSNYQPIFFKDKKKSRSHCNEVIPSLHSIPSFF